MKQAERYTLSLVAKPSEVPATVRLRKLLKVALRAFGLKCVGIARIDVDQVDHHQDSGEGGDQAGETLGVMKERGELAERGLNRHTKMSQPGTSTLEDLGLTRNQSSRYQQEAKP